MKGELSKIIKKKIITIKGIIYSKKLFEYIIKSSLDEVSSNIKGKIFEKCNLALV